MRTSLLPNDDINYLSHTMQNEMNNLLGWYDTRAIKNIPNFGSLSLCLENRKL